MPGANLNGATSAAQVFAEVVDLFIATVSLVVVATVVGVVGTLSAIPLAMAYFESSVERAVDRMPSVASASYAYDSRMITRAPCRI